MLWEQLIAIKLPLIYLSTRAVTFGRLAFYHLQLLGIVVHVKAGSRQARKEWLPRATGNLTIPLLTKQLQVPEFFSVKLSKQDAEGKENVLIFSILSFIFNEHISVVPAVIRKTRQNVFQILALVVSLEKRDPREAFAPSAYLTTPRANQPLENFARETFRTSAYL